MLPAAEFSVVKEFYQFVSQNLKRPSADLHRSVEILRLQPAFRTFAAKWPVESLEEALAEGIVTGHPDMPVFQFEPDQIAALLEHLTAIADAPKGQ